MTPSAPPQATPTQAQRELERLQALRAWLYEECNARGQALLDRAMFGAWLAVQREE